MTFRTHLSLFALEARENPSGPSPLDPGLPTTDPTPPPTTTPVLTAPTTTTDPILDPNGVTKSPLLP